MLDASLEKWMSPEQQERRARRRFALHIPVAIVAVNGVPMKQTARSHDISTCGLCFHTDSELDPGTSLELVLLLPREITGSDSIHVRCHGHVARKARESDGRGVVIGATIENQEFISEAE